MLEVTVLGSGSNGNSTLVRSGKTSILIDAGFSRRQIMLRLASIGVELEEIEAVVVSHEHTDHVAGLRVLCKNQPITVYASKRTLETECMQQACLQRTEAIAAGAEFTVGDIRIRPVSIPHDAADPLGFVVSSNGFVLGHVTDLGYAPEVIRRALMGCHLMVLESNHDPDMLIDGPYPWPIKQRILSRTGHLSNQAASELLGDVISPELRTLFLAHLSQQNNTCELAQEASERALDEKGCGEKPEIIVTSQFEPSATARLA